jgi:crotonobetainyl-CoA:carnitine CoA-transferase CaiB-like acyl-CoA transferase
MKTDNKPTFTVQVDDNFHFMDEDERWTAGTYGSLQKALDKCLQMVGQDLRQGYRSEITATDLYESYTTMGDDPRVVDPVARNQHIQWLYERVGEAAATRTVEEWLALCREHGIPAFRAATIDEVATDPALEASGTIATVEHPSEGAVRMLASAGFLDGEPARAARPAPRLGQHTNELLREIGYDDTAIAAMCARRAAVADDPPEETP